MWEVVFKLVLNYGPLGQRSGPVPVKLMNRDWNEFKIEQRDEFWACVGAFME